jgi:peptidoglycan-N-acetylglucosamine deacetylase
MITDSNCALGASWRSPREMPDAAGVFTSSEKTTAIPLSLNKMHSYFIKTPWFVKRFFSDYVWSIDNAENKIYLTFDDGPHPVITHRVLDELKQYNASATFFCIGNNVVKYPEVYQRILEEGHAVGNHTHDHLNGWKTKTPKYLENIATAKNYIDSHLFRPPYGKIRSKQADGVQKILGNGESIGRQRLADGDAKIVMWDVLSADFDQTITKEQCASNIIDNSVAGSIVVFHDSEKADRNLGWALPSALDFLSKKGFEFAALT